jgi:ABC-2 type transport system permease protein
VTTAVTPTPTPTGRAATRTSAPLGRLLGAELRWVLRRPRTLVVLALLALVPIAIAIGIATTGGPSSGRGPGLVAQVAGNGFVLPVVALGLSLGLLLPLAVASAAADAVAGEAATGTLRGLLLAPVGRMRLVVMKSTGVVTVAVIAVLLIAVVGMLAGTVVVGGAQGTLVTLSGTSLGVGEALGRIALVAVWTVGQLLAVGAVALAISTLTEHPLIVLASVLGGLIVFGVLSAIPSLEWLQPLLLTTGFTAGTDVLRDPMPLDGLASSTIRALVYIAVGLVVTVVRMRRRDA